MNAPHLFTQPAANFAPAIRRAGALAELKHKDGRDYSTFSLTPTRPATPEALPLLDLDDYAKPETGAPPLTGQLRLGE